MIYEEVKIMEKKPKSVEYLIYDCLGKLKNVDSIENISLEVVKKYLIMAQNEIIARLIDPFESYLHSKQYKQWQDGQIDAERKRQQVSHQHNQSSSAINHNIRSDSKIQNGNAAAAATGSPNQPNMNLHARSNSIGSLSAVNRPATCSDSYPDILVVDDSVVTLKLAKLTLERDGHNVDKAVNGQVALDLMKKRNYDVVLIDLNMPVMDGFETVRLFREYERDVNLNFPSDLSSISDSNDDDPIFASNRRSGYVSNRNHTQQVGRSNRGEPEEKHHSRKKGAAGGQVNVNEGEGKEENNDPNNPRIIGLNDPAAQLKIDSKFSRQITPAHYHQLIIGMSTNVDEQTRQRALEAGMDHFLPKPFTLQKFIEAIKFSRDEKVKLNGGKDVSQRGTHRITESAGEANYNSNRNNVAPGEVAQSLPHGKKEVTVSIHTTA